MSGSDIPDIVVRRLPLYARELGLLAGEGRTYVSSQELGERLQVTPAQIRKDLSYFGRFGKQGRGYEVGELRRRVREILGLNGRVRRMVLVGVGQLGRAVLGHASFRPQGFEVEHAFDADWGLVGEVVEDVPIDHISKLTEYLSGRRVQIGIVAVPAQAAREVIETLVAGGVRAILSYAPITTRVPSGVHLRQIDPVMELESMAYYLPRGVVGESEAEEAGPA